MGNRRQRQKGWHLTPRGTASGQIIFPPWVCLPFARGFQSDVSFFVRFHSLPAGMESNAADLLRRTVREIDQGLPVISLKTFQQHLDADMELWVVRAGAALFSIFGGLALGLAAV